MATKPLSTILLLGSVAAVLVCLWIGATTNPTGHETLLLGIILTIASMLGSWVASQYYAEASYSSSLKTFALKAAEKVNNLSNELDRLSGYIQRELNAQDYKTAEEALLARDMSIEAVVHMVGILKSVNDGALSDWRGVIGKELEHQDELKEERERDFRALVSRLEQLEAAQDTSEEDQTSQDVSRLRREIENVRAEVRVMGAQLGTVPLSRPPRFPLTKVDTKCPDCGNPLSYKQRPKPAQVKPLKCARCGAKLTSTFSDGAFLLQVRKAIPESISCPSCEEVFSVGVDPFRGVESIGTCPRCKERISVTRTSSGVVPRKFEPTTLQGPSPAAPVPDETFIETVRKLMPVQPWPKGTVATVAAGLKVSNASVNRALSVLIQRGYFKLQIDGRLYEPIQPPPNKEKD